AARDPSAWHEPNGVRGAAEVGARAVRSAPQAAGRIRSALQTGGRITSALRKAPHARGPQGASRSEGRIVGGGWGRGRGPARAVVLRAHALGPVAIEMHCAGTRPEGWMPAQC